MKAQISIEYLILIAAVLAITALIVAMVAGVFKGQSSDLQYQMCRQAAASCALTLKQEPTAECSACWEQCKDVRDGTDIVSKEPIDTACNNPSSACGMCMNGWAQGIIAPTTTGGASPDAGEDLGDLLGGEGGEPPLPPE